MLKRPSFWKTNLLNKLPICGSGARCVGERPPIESQSDLVETGLDKNAVHRILIDHLRVRKLVPKNLSVGPKANRLQICHD